MSVEKRMKPKNKYNLKNKIITCGLIVVTGLAAITSGCCKRYIITTSGTISTQEFIKENRMDVGGGLYDSE